MYGTRSSMDVDTNAGRGEQVIDHYLPGAVTNYGLRKKKLQKTKENSVCSIRRIFTDLGGKGQKQILEPP